MFYALLSSRAGVRVSGGDLVADEAPTDAAAETRAAKKQCIARTTTANCPRAPARRLFVAEGVDGVEVGGFDGGNETEDDAYAHREAN